jgi:hypothetical protein
MYAVIFCFDDEIFTLITVCLFVLHDYPPFLA